MPVDGAGPDADAFELARRRTLAQVPEQQLRLDRRCAAGEGRPSVGGRLSGPSRNGTSVSVQRVRSSARRASSVSSRVDRSASAATSSGTVASTTAVDAEAGLHLEVGAAQQPDAPRAVHQAVVVAHRMHGACVGQQDVEPLALLVRDEIVEASVPMRERRRVEPIGLGDGRGRRPALAQAWSIEVIAAHDALLEAGHVLARAAHVGDPVDDEVERDRGVDAELPAGREVEPDGEHVGGVQLEVPLVSGDGVRLAGFEVARQVVVRQRGRVDRGQGLVRGDRGRSFGGEVRARDLAPGPISQCVSAATRLRRR